MARMLWGFIENRDHRVMRQMNRWRAPRWFRIWMILSTRLGDGWLWYGLGIMLLAWGGPQRLAAIGAAGSAALRRRADFQSPQTFEPSCAAMPIRTALLVKSFAAGQIFVSLGAHHDGVFHRAGAQLFLSRAGRHAFLFSGQHRLLTHRVRHAFSQRCACGGGTGRGARLRIHHRICISGLDIRSTVLLTKLNNR